jgi:hypothetical protein
MYCVTSNPIRLSNKATETIGLHKVKPDSVETLVPKMYASMAEKMR